MLEASRPQPPVPTFATTTNRSTVTRTLFPSQCRRRTIDAALLATLASAALSWGCEHRALADVVHELAAGDEEPPPEVDSQGAGTGGKRSRRSEPGDRVPEGGCQRCKAMSCDLVSIVAVSPACCN